MEIPEGRKKRNTAIKHEMVSPMTSILELSSQDISAREIDGPRVGADLDEVDVIKQEAVATAVAVRGEPSINRWLDIQAEQDTPAVEDIQEQDQAVRDNSRRKQSRSLAQ